MLRVILRAIWNSLAVAEWGKYPRFRVYYIALGFEMED